MPFWERALDVGDSDLDEVVDVLIGAPGLKHGQGAVFHVSGLSFPNVSELEIQGISEWMLDEGGASLLGTRVAFADLDSDGRDDRVAAAPGSDLGRGLILISMSGEDGSEFEFRGGEQGLEIPEGRFLDFRVVDSEGRQVLELVLQDNDSPVQEVLASVVWTGSQFSVVSRIAMEAKTIAETSRSESAPLRVNRMIAGSNHRIQRRTARVGNLLSHSSSPLTSEHDNVDPEPEADSDLDGQFANGHSRTKQRVASTLQRATIFEDHPTKGKREIRPANVEDSEVGCHSDQRVDAREAEIATMVAGIVLVAGATDSESKYAQHVEDSEILALIRDGDESGFRYLMLKYGGRIMSSVQHFFRSRADSEDVLQEVMMNLYRKAQRDREAPEQAREIESLWGYVKVVARNAAADRLRKSDAAKVFASEYPEDFPEPAMDTPSWELIESLELAIELLPEKERVVMSMDLESILTRDHQASNLAVQRQLIEQGLVDDISLSAVSKLRKKAHEYLWSIECANEL